MVSASGRSVPEGETPLLQVEKLVKENDTKLSGSDKKPLEDAIAKTRESAKGQNVDAIRAQRAGDELKTPGMIVDDQD